MLNILSVGLGGFLGAVGRYIIGLIPIKESLVFPIKTFSVNNRAWFIVFLEPATPKILLEFISE